MKLLINLIKSAGISDNVLFDAVKSLVENCSTCFKYKKPKCSMIFIST